MNSHRFLSLLLLLFVLCFALFSASYTAHAANNSSSSVYVESSPKQAAVMSVDDVASTIDNIQYFICARNSSSMNIQAILLDYTIKAGSWGIQHSVDLGPYRFSNFVIGQVFSYTKGSGNLIASKGSSVKFDLSGIYNLLVSEYNGTRYESYSHPENIKSITVSCFDNQGNVFQSFEVPKTSFYSTTLNNSRLDCINFEIDTLTSDLYKIQVEVDYFASSMFSDIPSSAWNNSPDYRLLTGFVEKKTMLQVFVDNGETGLLKGILSGITELPSKIWNLVENGLKGLFVPTESQMTDVKGQWDSLLSERFGGLYQTVQLIDDYAATFKEPSSSHSSIDFPEFRLNVGSDSEFVLQAHDVQIVPDRFSFLVDVVKTIISIISTCLFINGLRNKFERLVGGHE